MKAKNKSTGNDTTTTPRLKVFKLADVKPHPDQERYFRSYGDFEYAQLKADIAATRVRVPPEVLPAGNAAGLPDGTLIKGHTRCKIWGELGHTSIEVLVRYDLQNVERAHIDEEFLRDNIARRQQDKLGQARAAVGLYLIERAKKGRMVSGDPLRVGEVRDRVGQIVGMSGRNLQRYLNVLAARPEVQDAFAAGRVRLVDAARVVGLSKREQEALADRLRGGGDPKAVLAEFFPKGDGRHVRVGDAVAAFCRAIEKSHADLDGRIDPLSAKAVRKFEGSLRRGRQVIEGLLAKLEVNGRV
jgi:hypothetical protein